ncbi:MAG: ABC transporter ATP-binding protein, partial [Actinomycetota bacterium]
MAEPGLVAEGIVVRFGGLVALDHVGIEVQPGRITGLIGPNGAGKTTMFNVCCGFQRADLGRVTYDGVDITDESPAHRARRGLGRTFQRMQLFRSLTVRENVEIAAESAHISNDPLRQLGIRGGGRAVQAAVAAKADSLLEAVGLTDFARRTAGEVSTGQGRLVELARALAREPRILLLDEPSSGLDPAETAAFGELLLRLMRVRGIGVLLV